MHANHPVAMRLADGVTYRSETVFLGNRWEMAADQFDGILEQ